MTDNKLYTPESVKAREIWWNELSRRGDPLHLTNLFAAFHAGWEAREGSLRTPAAPQIAERIACQLDIDEPGTSPETHAYNVRWITAIIESARGEASQPAPQPTPPCDHAISLSRDYRGPREWCPLHGAAETPAQPTLIETLGQTAPGAVPWSPVAIESPAQPSPGKICKQCGKPFTDTTMWQLRVSCDECTFGEAAASPSAERRDIKGQ
jgi:hypothetical protein